MRIDPRPDRFEHRIRVLAKFTVAELRVIKYLSDMHYDHKCKTFFGSGNTGNYWRNSFQTLPEEGKEFGDYIDPFDPSCPEDLECDDVHVSLGDLGLCMKILEEAWHEKDEEFLAAVTALRKGLDEVGDAIAAEYNRVREKERKELAAAGARLGAELGIEVLSQE